MGRPQNSRRDVTTWLKGVAILSVLTNHFLDVYITKAFSGYANGIISLFFIISGCNMYFSLEQHRHVNLSSVTYFFLKRFFRIYPLFWLSFVLVCVYHHRLYPAVTFFLPNFRTMITYWFINALIQCYLIAPLLYLFLRRYGVVKYSVGVTIVILFLNIYPSFSSITNEVFFVKYKWLFMLHILLFAIGMTFPLIIRRIERSMAIDNKIVILSLVVFLVFVHLTRHRGIVSPNAYLIFVPLFVLSALWFCFCAILNFSIPSFRWVFVGIGTYSYSLYLFHFDYFFLLKRMGLVSQNNFMSMMSVLICFPIFCTFCYFLETYVGKATSFLLSKTDGFAGLKGA